MLGLYSPKQIDKEVAKKKKSLNKSISKNMKESRGSLRRLFRGK